MTAMLLNKPYDFFSLPSKIISNSHDFIYTTIIIQDNKFSNSVKTDFMESSKILRKLFIRYKLVHRATRRGKILYYQKYKIY